MTDNSSSKRDIRSIRQPAEKPKPIVPDRTDDREFGGIVSNTSIAFHFARMRMPGAAK